MDYQQFGSMSSAVPNLYRNSGVLRYGGGHKQERNEASGGRRRQDLRVRLCLSGSTVINEFKFETELLNAIEVVKQVNNNFIAAVVLSQDKKVLVLMDQHAIHERIRYENLLKDYTMQDQKCFLSTKLDVPILVNDLPKHHCKWLLAHSKQVEYSGIRLKSDKMSCLVVTSIPKCFDRKKFNQGRAELERTVRKLLIEMTNDLDCSYMPSASMPMIIHLAIATEACHGAIKFGEKLDIDQCIKLVKSLMHTKAPSRCAHGRPSVIPLLELKDLEKYQSPISRQLLFLWAIKFGEKLDIDQCIKLVKSLMHTKAPIVDVNMDVHQSPISRGAPGTTYRLPVSSEIKANRKWDSIEAISEEKTRLNGKLYAACNTKIVTAMDMLNFGRQIATGIEFLSSKKIVHRDFATRNVLVCSDRTVKVSDFGLSLNIYLNNVYKKWGNDRIPLKWMVIEALTHQVYSTHSDVWSFGILLWEIVTLGSSPYPDIPANGVLKRLRLGYSMERPSNCSVPLYNLMLSCWQTKPRDRPTFTVLRQEFDKLLCVAADSTYINDREPCVVYEDQEGPRDETKK